MEITRRNRKLDRSAGIVSRIITATILFISFIHGSGGGVALADPAGSLAESPRRTLIIALDSLHPYYIEMNRDASGFGSEGDWLMPNVRAALKDGTRWTDARSHFPQTTDSNHLNIVAGTNASNTGIYGVLVTPDTWKRGGYDAQYIHTKDAKYEDGEPVSTLFQLYERNTNGSAVTAYVSTKAWVPFEYYQEGADADSVDIIATPEDHPAFVEAPQAYVPYDNPETDEDWACDPESAMQTASLEHAAADPTLHGSPYWTAEAALSIMENEEVGAPDFMYVLMGNVDYVQHMLGAVNDPAEWGYLPELHEPLPEGCEDRVEYHMVSKKNPRIYKEPILDFLKDVDRAFGQLMDGLKAGGHLEDTILAIVSDHNMTNFMYRDGITEATDIRGKLIDAGLYFDRNFCYYGGGSVAMLSWNPAFKEAVPIITDAVRMELMSPEHIRYNHYTGTHELPWSVLGRDDFITGVPELGIEPMEFVHPYLMEHGIWPDLVVILNPGWQLPKYTADGGLQWNFQAAHGAPDTSQVVVGFQGLDYEPGDCGGKVHLSDVGVTIADALGWEFPQSVGEVLECTP